VLERWLTSRCWHEDAPALTTARGAIIKFLEQQDQRASGTEPFAAAERPDTFTYHFGSGRGVRWHDINPPAQLSVGVSKTCPAARVMFSRAGVRRDT
jgi:hypothetical protein